MNTRRAARSLAILMILVSAPRVVASDEWVLFVNSQPIGAEVRIDKTLLPGTTPMIIRRADPGTYTFTIRKESYEPATEDLVLAGGQVREMSAQLVPRGLSITLPRNDTAVVAGSEVTAGDSVLQLTGDRFLIESDSGTVRVRPRPGLERLGDALSIVAPVMMAFGTLLTVDAVVNPPENGPVLPPTVIAVHGVTAAAIGLNVGIQISRARAARDFRVAVEARGDPDREQRLLEEADEHLANGDIERSLERYDELLSEFPTSDYVPEALHRSAGVLILLGEVSAAESRFSRIVQELPVADFYDTSLKNLADIAYQRGEYDEALSYLDKITYFRSPFTRAEILEYVEELESLRQQTP